MKSFDRGLVRRAGGVLAAAVLLALAAACGDYDVTTAERVMSLRERDLTAAGPLRAQRRDTVDDRIAALGLPLAAPGGYRLCGGDVGNSRMRHGNRESIRSSAEGFTDSKFFLTFAGTPGGTLERQLFQSSARHDFCYGHGAGTSGRTRHDCDLDMFADINRLCRASAEALERRAGAKSEDDDYYAASISACRSRGFWMKAAVDVFGDTAYGDNFLNHCENDVGAQPPRDLVIAGRFLQASQQLLEVRAITDLAHLELVMHERDGSGGWKALSPVVLDLAAIAVLEGENGEPLVYDESKFYPPRVDQARRCVDRLTRPYVLSDLARSVHFLSYAPVIADIDGSGRDSLVLVAVNVRRPDPAVADPCGWGPIFLPIAFDRDAAGKMTVRASTALRPAGPNTRPGDIKYRFGSNIDRFEHRLHAARGLLPMDRTAIGVCSGGDQIVAPFIGTNSYNFQQIQVRVYEFCVTGQRVVRMRSHDWKAADTASEAKRFWGTPDGEEFAHELYKRFQHPPRLLSTSAGPALQFYFRSKCDGQHGYCADHSVKDRFDLDNMLVQRLVPVRMARPARQHLAPDIRTTLDWRLFEGWPADHRRCLDRQTKLTSQAHKFGCHAGWDRNGHPAAIVPGASPRHDTTLLSIHLTNCGLGDADMDARGFCRIAVPAKPETDVAPHDGHHERLRLSVIETTLDATPGPRAFDIDSPSFRSAGQYAEPRLAASWRTHPPIAMSFGTAGAGLVLLRPSDPDTLDDYSPLAIDAGKQYQRDSATAQTKPRVLRLLVISAARPSSATASWTAREFVCALPAELGGRRWPLRAAPVLRANRDAGDATLAIVARPLTRTAAAANPGIVVNGIEFAGATPTRSTLDGWSGPCTPAQVQDWEVRPVPGRPALVQSAAGR